MRSIRLIFAAQEGLTLLVVAVFAVIFFALLQSEIKQSYMKAQASQIDQVDTTILAFLEENQSLFSLFLDGRDNAASGALLRNFSDIYRCDARCVVTEIVKKDEKSMIFPGYDLGRSALCAFLKEGGSPSIRQSALIRSPENGRTSVYIAAGRGDRIVVGRIGLRKLSASLVRIAHATSSTIVLATRDGYILSSTREPLPFYSLRETSLEELTIFGSGHLYARKRSRVLDNDIAIFTPLGPVYRILRQVRIAFLVFIAVIVAITAVRTAIHTARIIRPLAEFTAMIKGWEPETMPRVPPGRFTEYREIASLYHGFTERSMIVREALSALRESEEKFRTTVSAMSDLVFVFDEKGRFVFHHAPEETDLFLPPARFPGKTVRETMPPHIHDVLDASLEKNARGETADFDFSLDRDGETRWFSAKLSPSMVSGEYRGSIAVVRDITGRKLSEEQAVKSLMEREVLLKEIHHRVKNNLTVIMSLLSLQADAITSREQAVEAFRESANRILSMAMVHEKLYSSADFSKVDLREYMETMVPGIISTYNVGYAVDTVIDVEDILLDINKAIPCGLILNELVSNALKYAFEGMDSGRIHCSLHARGDGELEFTVGDNGAGLPPGFDIEKVETLGLKLVHLLSKQLKGTLSIVTGTGAGTTFTLVFPG